MTEQTLYRIAIRGHDRIQKAKGDFYLSEEGVTAELESVRNFKGDVVHLAIYQADLPDLPMAAIDWLRERNLPLTHVEFLKANPNARRQAVLIEKRDLYRAFYKRFANEGHELRCQIEDDLDQRPITEAHADVFDELVACLNQHLQAIDKQIAD